MTTTPIPESADATVEALRKERLEHAAAIEMAIGWGATLTSREARIKIIDAALAHTPKAATCAPAENIEVLAQTVGEAIGDLNEGQVFGAREFRFIAERVNAMLAAAPPAPQPGAWGEDNSDNRKEVMPYGGCDAAVQAEAATAAGVHVARPREEVRASGGKPVPPAALAAPAAEPDAGVRELLLEARSGLQAFGGEACAHTIARIDARLVSHPQPASPQLGARLAGLSARAPKGEWTVTFDEVGEGPDRKPIAFLENDRSILAVDEDPEASEYLSPTLELSAELVNAYRAGHLVVPTPSPDPEPRPADVEGAPYGIIDPDYARVYSIARCIAWSEGYALVMHGSFTRDLDLLAVPWAEKATDAEHLVRRISSALDDLDLLIKDPNALSQATNRPHGRLSWTMAFKAFGDPRFVDISVMPAITTVPTPSPDPEPRPADDEGLREPLSERMRIIGETLRKYPPEGLVRGNLYVAAKNPGEGTGWRYIAIDLTVSDLDQPPTPSHPAHRGAEEAPKAAASSQAGSR